MPLEAQDRAAQAARNDTDDPAGYVLEEQAGHLLRRAHQRHSAIFQATIGDDQLTPLQFAALMKLSDVGETSQNLLGRLTAMDAATMQGVIKRLSARGLIDRRLSVREVLSERLFPSRVELPEDLAEMYWERVPTRQLPRLRRHELRHAA